MGDDNERVREYIERYEVKERDVVHVCNYHSRIAKEQLETRNCLIWDCRNSGSRKRPFVSQSQGQLDPRVDQRKSRRGRGNERRKEGNGGLKNDVVHA